MLNRFVQHDTIQQYFTFPQGSNDLLETDELQPTTPTLPPDDQLLQPNAAMGYNLPEITLIVLFCITMTLHYII